jgi:hypothetical protein
MSSVWHRTMLSHLILLTSPPIIPCPYPVYTSALYPNQFSSSSPSAYSVPAKSVMDPPTSPSPLLVRYSDKPTENTQPDGDEAPAAHGVPKDWKFWCIIFSLCLSVLLTAVEFVSCFSWLAWWKSTLALKNLDSNALHCKRRPQSELLFRRSYVTWRASSSFG